MKWWIAGALAAVGLIVASFFALKREEAPVALPPEADVPGTRSVELFFPGVAGGVAPEMREIVGGDSVEEDIRRVVAELARGSADGLRPLPPSTRLINVFQDGEGEVTLNFSEHLRADHPGGSAAELATVRCLVSTVGANFPGADRVRILVEGEVVPTLAGHVDLREPLQVRAYR